MKLSVVVPAYNEKSTLESILARVKEVDFSDTPELPDIEKEIIIIDDCSTDGTTQILQELQKSDPDIVVIFKKTNEGKGFALRDGFRKTTGDYVIVQDADLEYDPNDFKKLLRAVVEDGADVVYGSRFSGTYKDMSNLHYYGNKILTIITNIFFGVLLTDMETCYKLMPGKFARQVEIKSARFNFEPEITAKILKSGLKIVEVPISYQGRSHNEGKKITWRDGLSALFTLIKFRFTN
ncbi:glycosyltransferase family 2 protein [Candidatus Nomurabacteria bacterium]|uniref:Glycosyltransferase family 2 protein n=1 Tax=candidate division WWE3 bacterium TaxID=2053526 RepID=A0A955IWE2_UNCKA|nr:glycosyltransferase family 2 protein [candidate division WWE3 bacterium]MCB9824151.1 glycosyltransferase family 2 protein [Candidatus Nomurabacteria bacterium]MCB9826878.1 glycosyltransferase family 2 protein [Candidatus Nomurabacteria bacterium]MCB9828092.1 glycosyltransferase family 2 protein [Candidatus Nomurabacteria bacterium]HXK52464.1 glycosyltransferase family 2 protein [bacterium]